MQNYNQYFNYARIIEIIFVIHQLLLRHCIADTLLSAFRAYGAGDMENGKRSHRSYLCILHPYVAGTGARDAGFAFSKRVLVTPIFA